MKALSCHLGSLIKPTSVRSFIPANCHAIRPPGQRGSLLFDSIPPGVEHACVTSRCNL